MDLRFEAASLYAVRSSVAAHAAGLGATPEVMDRVLIVASELSTNAIRHGGGSGRVRLWTTDGRIYCEVSDTGNGVADLDSGTKRPDPRAAGGRGLWISRQLGDDFAISSGPEGTTVRVAIALHDARESTVK